MTFFEWRKRNPLRKWRQDRATSALAAAAMLGVSAQVLSRWEGGASMPNDENIVLIADLIGEDVHELQARWQRWREEARTMRE